MEKQQPPPYSPPNQGPVYPNLNQPYSQPGQYAPGYSQPGYVPQTSGVQGVQAQPVQQTIIINRSKFGPFPARTECQICKHEVLTDTESSPGLLSWLLCGACCFIGCWFGCCLIPCCLEACRDIVHKCPNCKSQIALYKRL